jgi:catechol 2,3-dioxygenase-like lactoylglutathione lyase family enzyme
MNQVEVEQKNYQMPPQDRFTIVHFLTVSDIERSVRFYQTVFGGRILSMTLSVPADPNLVSSCPVRRLGPSNKGGSGPPLGQVAVRRADRAPAPHNSTALFRRWTRRMAFAPV